MINITATIVGIIGLILAWHLFYNVVRARTPQRLRLKVTLIVLIFSSLIFKFSNDLYAAIMRGIFSIQKQGEVQLVVSPFRIPETQDIAYCNQFTDQNNKVITSISVRNDGRYCGNFWQFKTKKELFLPYKQLNATHRIYWANPYLQIIAPLSELTPQPRGLTNDSYPHSK